MKPALVGLALFFGVLLLSVTSTGSEPVKAEPKAEPPKDDSGKIHLLMMRKLENSQKLLEAITQNNQKSVQKLAEDLVQITNEKSWKIMETREYETFTSEFRRAAEQLVRNAKDKNLDGAQLTYLEMTLACFNCHKYMRDQK